MLTARVPAGLAGARCVVLGAGGFLGGAVCRTLADNDASVIGFGRRGPVPVAAAAAWHDADFRDREALRRALDGADVVFHLIGRVTSKDGVPNARSPYVAQSVAMLDDAVAAGVRKVVFASSGGTVYGDAPTVPTPESAPLRPLCTYGAQCVEIEGQLERHRRLYGLDYHVLRIANAYGPGQSPHRGQGVVASMLFRALSGRPLEIWGSPATTRDFVYVTDVAAAFAAAACYGGEQRIMNVGSSRGRTLGGLASEIAGLVGAAPPAISRRPPRTGDVAVSVLDTSLIERALNWRAAVPWAAGLAETLRWVRTA